MKSKDLKIIFGGTPDFASYHLNYLLEQGFNIVAAYTQPDRVAGRGKKITYSPVKQLALDHNIPVEQPINFKDPKDCEIFKSYQADLFVVVAYGVILPKVILDAPRYGCINVHGSLLPKYRGAAPIQRAVYNGDQETGITIMRMNEKLDEGDILSIKSINIDAKDTSDSLFNKLTHVGATLLCDTIDQIAQSDNKLSSTPQDHSLATYAAKLTKDEARIDFNESAEVIERHLRAFISWPVGYIELNGMAIKIWDADVVVLEQNNAQPGTILQIDKNGILVATAHNALKLNILQLPGKKSMRIADLLNGHSDLFKINQIL